jgi:hypothetical protein
VDAEHRQQRDRLAVGPVDADDEEIVIVLPAAREIVVLAAPIAVDLVLGIEVAVVRDADARGTAARERRAHRGLHVAEQRFVRCAVERAEADLHRAVPGVVRERRVRVAHREEHLAGELGPEPRFELVREALVRDAELGLHDQDRLVARGP